MAAALSGGRLSPPSPSASLLIGMKPNAPPRAATRCFSASGRAKKALASSAHSRRSAGSMPWPTTTKKPTVSAASATAAATASAAVAEARWLKNGATSTTGTAPLLVPLCALLGLRAARRAAGGARALARGPRASAPRSRRGAGLGGAHKPPAGAAAAGGGR